MTTVDQPANSATMGAIAMLLADGRLPTGAHAHSAGLEAATRFGDVTDVDTLTRFVVGRLATQGRLDAAFAAAAARCWAETPSIASVDSSHALVERNTQRLERLGAEFDARTPSPHLRDTSRTLGRHLLRAASSIIPDPDDLRSALRGAPRPIVTGVVVSDLGLPPDFAATMELHHLVSGVCGAAVKLLGLDPLAIVGVQAGLAPDIDAIAAECSIPFGSAELPATTCARADVLAEWHAADSARLFAT